jgi:hypothetical protein
MYLFVPPRLNTMGYVALLGLKSLDLCWARMARLVTAGLCFKMDNMGQQNPKLASMACTKQSKEPKPVRFTKMTYI